MSYWLTTQWPHLKSERADQIHDGVYVQPRNEDVIKKVKRGDLVLIYESESGKAIRVSEPSGIQSVVGRHRGRGGIVAIAEATDGQRPRNGSRPQHYTDGTSAWWKHYVPTQSLNSVGFVPRSVLLNVLGYKDNYNLHGFGEANSGLKEITPSQFESLREAFTQSAATMEQAQLQSISRQGFGGGGEGPEHLALKELIAGNPSEILGEPGLCLWRMEWPFVETGDRIDVVLKDRFGRFVAVEVEVDCDGVHMAGPLQCMKYRAMLSYYFNRPLEEFRTMLVAHSIHRDLEDRCHRHLIESVRIPRSG